MVEWLANALERKSGALDKSHQNRAGNFEKTDYNANDRISKLKKNIICALFVVIFGSNGPGTVCRDPITVRHIDRFPDVIGLRLCQSGSIRK